MFGKPERQLLKQLDETVDQYIVALAFVQNSIKLPEHRKAEFFTVLSDFCTDVATSIEELKRSGINMWNRTEAEDYLSSSVPVIIAGINNELRKIGKVVRIDGSAVMPVQSAIDMITKEMHGKPFIPRDMIDRLFSYKPIFENTPQEENTVNEKPAAIPKTDTFDKAMEEIRLSAFLGMLRGSGNRNPEYFFKTNGFAVRQITDAVVPFHEPSIFPDGLSFSSPGPDTIAVRFRSAAMVTEYTVMIRTEQESSVLTIGGYIEKDEARVDFSIFETYPKKAHTTVINAFGLSRILENYSESEREYRNARKGIASGDRTAKKIIDDFFNS